MRLITPAALLLCMLLAGAARARTRSDERGNPVADSAAESAIHSDANGKPASAPKDAELPEASQSPASQAQTNDEAGKSDEETVQQQARHPLTRVYYENAQLYLRSGRTEKALEFLRRSQEAGEDSYSREARLQAYWLRARRGDTGLAVEAENLDESLKPAALLRVADGYYTCSREVKSKPDCLAEAERVYALLAELAPTAAEGKLSAFRLAQLLLEQERLEAALPHLTRLLADEQKQGKKTPAIPYDRAWYALGSLYERPWYHRDVHKARQAYQQVLRYPESPYQRQARERIGWLTRFGTGHPRTGSAR